MSKMDSLAAPSKGIYFAVVLQSMCDMMNGQIEMLLSIF